MEHANQTWRDRVIIQRYTGMRPGEVRRLRKSRVNFTSGEIHLLGRDTKTGTGRSFRLPPQALTILKRLKLVSDGPFFFPNECDSNRPMTPTMKSWHSAWRRAGIDNGYTPHCLRHSYLTEMFKNGQNPALICYAAGLSLEEAQKTYLHFTAQDTLGIADAATDLVGIA